LSFIWKRISLHPRHSPIAPAARLFDFALLLKNAGQKNQSAAAPPLLSLIDLLRALTAADQLPSR
jgi:hypothetical protein